MLSVHVRINDAATGRPTPVRVRFLSGAGEPHAPLGRLVDFATGPGQDVGGHLRLGPERWCYVDGACEIPLPPGPVTVEASKGPEFSPVRHAAVLAPGKLALRLTIARWTDLRAEGWYSGDTRAHALSPHAALLEAGGEDLAIVQLLARERPTGENQRASLENILAFSGMEAALQTDGRHVAVNTLNEHPILGTVSLLNCHRAVYPLRFGAPGLDDWSVSDWCDQCHRKRGLVIWSDVARLTEDHPQGEAVAALLQRKIDAFEVSAFPDPEPAVLGDYYRLLDLGLRVPLVGGSGKDSNAIALGSVRTYARLQPSEPLSHAGWIEAVRAGRTFITNAPLLKFTVDGQDPGSVVAVGSTGRPFPIRMEAQSQVPFDQLELLVNGQIVASKTASGNRQSALLELEHRPTRSCWIAARCWSREPFPGQYGRQCVFAHSSPVYVHVEGSRLLVEQAKAAPLLEALDRTASWIANSARCPSEKERGHLAEAVGAGRAELLRRIREDGTA